jgi:O-antigen/teichoic acid export membrane protein
MSTAKVALRGSFTQLLARYSSLLIQFLVIVVLARKLEPGDFGVIGLLTVFIAISNILVESGFNAALIRREHVSNEDLSSVMYFNCLFSLLLYFILFLASPYIATFYNIPELTGYARVVFLVIPINALSFVQTVILSRKLLFSQLSLIQVISAIVSAFVAIICAYNGCGIMSLVYHNLALHATSTALKMVFNRWIPSFSFSFKVIKELLPFSINLTITSLIKVIFQNIYTLIIGKVSTVHDVGLYNQGKRLEELSGNTIVDVVKGVAYPILSKYRDNTEMLKKAYSYIIRITVSVVAPLMLFFICASKEVIEIVYSEKWLDAVPYFKLLCLYGATLPLHLLNENVLKVVGDSKQILKIEIFRRVFLVIAIVSTIRIGVSAMLIGQIVATLPIIVISMRASGQYIGYSLSEQFRDVIWFYFSSAIAYVACFVLGMSMENHVVVQLAVKVCLFFIVYIIVLLIINKSFIIMMKDLIKTYRRQ